MSDGLEIKVIPQGQEVVIELIGRIDEDSHLESILKLTSSHYTFDFNGVNLINSCGVREWINLVSKLAQNASITYRHCPQIMIEQMNMVQGFFPPGVNIQSFYAPYFDPDQDKEVKILIETKEVNNFKAPVKRNDQGSLLEFDALEAQYFNFLK